MTLRSLLVWKLPPSSSRNRVSYKDTKPNFQTFPYGVLKQYQGSQLSNLPPADTRVNKPRITKLTDMLTQPTQSPDLLLRAHKNVTVGKVIHQVLDRYKRPTGYRSAHSARETHDTARGCGWEMPSKRLTCSNAVSRRRAVNNSTA